MVMNYPPLPLMLLAVTLSFLGCDKDKLISLPEEKSTDYFFRVTLPDGEEINFDEAAVSHDPASNVYFIVAGLSECGPIVSADSSRYVYIFHVPAEESNVGEELNTALITNYPVTSGPLTAVSGRDDVMPCVDSPSRIQFEPSAPSTWRGSYTAQFYTFDDDDRSCSIDMPNGYVGIGEVRMEFYAPLLLCE